MKTLKTQERALKKIENNLVKSSNGDFRFFLQETLVLKCKNNPSYSLRAFAKFLNLEPSFLSKVLAGKRNVTPLFVKKVGEKLLLSPTEQDTFLVATKKGSEKKSASKELNNFYKDLSVDHFKFIADWYHYGILELMLVEDFSSDAGWIAKKLGIKKIEVKAALERLERLDIIQKNDNGEYENISGNLTTTKNEFTHLAFRKLQKQILLQALEALENVPMEERSQTSMTMAIDPALIPEAKEKINSFRRELCTFLQENNRPKSKVYQMSLSLFPVTN